jgi:hypothetical protein
MSELQTRSMNLLKSKGYLVASVERRKTFPAKGKQRCRACGQVQLLNIASDLWNFADLLAIRKDLRAQSGGGVDCILVQVTSASNHASRRNKILASPEAKLCILAGCSILIQSWRKKDNRWMPMDEWITVDQFCAGLPSSAEEFYKDQARAKLLKRGDPPSRTLPREEDLDNLPF